MECTRSSNHCGERNCAAQVAAIQEQISHKFPYSTFCWKHHPLCCKKWAKVSVLTMCAAATGASGEKDLIE